MGKLRDSLPKGIVSVQNAHNITFAGAAVLPQTTISSKQHPWPADDSLPQRPWNRAKVCTRFVASVAWRLTPPARQIRSSTALPGRPSRLLKIALRADISPVMSIFDNTCDRPHIETHRPTPVPSTPCTAAETKG